MGRETSIGWTDSTLNLAWGCTKVSEGCINCYMFRNSPMYGRDPSKVEILSFTAAKKRLQTYGEKVFVNSNSDTFHEAIPFETIDKWFELFSQNRGHIFQVLTKRINRARLYAKVRKNQGHAWPANVWLGTSVENDAHAFRIRTLQLVEGPKVKFVSFEPLLGPITCRPDLFMINWAIIGGESGNNPRPMAAEWAQELIDYIRTNYADCAIFFKQMGGKGRDGAGGDLLNGQRYKEFPSY